MGIVRDSRNFSAHPYIGRIARSSLRQLSFLVMSGYFMCCIFMSVIFMPCYFMPCKLVRQFHVRHFHVRHFRPLINGKTPLNMSQTDSARRENGHSVFFEFSLFPLDLFYFRLRRLRPRRSSVRYSAD